MATKVNQKLSVIAQIPQGSEGKAEDTNFEIKASLAMMVQDNPFSGEDKEEVVAHLWQFLHLCDTVLIEGVSKDAICLRLFPFFS